MKAGPAVKADARKRGASSGEFHNGRDGGAAKRNAVMRWILTAHTTER
jgi:alpha/beta superfamily hydrolase